MFFKEIIKKINFSEGAKRIFLIIKIIWFLCFIFLAFKAFSAYQFRQSKINPSNIDIADAIHYLIISMENALQIKELYSHQVIKATD